jgi:probable F420-dependent oxidoreductase
MLIDSPVGEWMSGPQGQGWDGLRSQVQAAEVDGFDGIFAAETSHDPFIALTVAAGASDRLDLSTGIAVAFARNPMTIAIAASDLQTLSNGRFTLGLGSQVKTHIERRYSMPWSEPAARMREFILAVRAIWESWETGERLNFEGRFYRHTLMTAAFSPGPSAYGWPKIVLAAVGSLMTETAATVADGLFVHGFTTERYLREVTAEVVSAGLERSGRRREDFTICFSGFVVTGTSEAEFLAAKSAVARQIAFYGSTPSYRQVLALHGWESLSEELHVLSRRQEWSQMQALIDDDVLSTFAVAGEPDQIAPMLLSRFGGLVDRFSLYTPYELNPEARATIVGGLRG